MQRLHLLYPQKYPLLTQLYESEKGSAVYSLKDPNYKEEDSTVIVHALHRAAGKSLKEILSKGNPEQKTIALKAAGKTLANANLAGVTFVDCSLSNIFVKVAETKIVSWIDTSEVTSGCPRDENFYLAGIIRNLRDILSYCSSGYPFSVDQVKEKSSYFMIMFAEYMNVFKTVYPQAPKNIYNRLNDVFNVAINKNTNNSVFELTLWENNIMTGVREEITGGHFPYDEGRLNCAFETITKHPAWNKLLSGN